MPADLEGAKDAIKVQLLSDEFAAVVIAIFEEKQQEAPAEVVNEVYTVLKWAPQNFPNAQLGPARGFNKNPDGNGLVDLEYEITLYWELTDSDEERLGRLTERYVRATQDFYASRPNLLVEQTNCSIWTGDEDYSPLINQGDGKPFIQAAAVTLFLRMAR